MKVVGLSMSSCVSDIADGKVNYDDVVAIWANTLVPGDRWDEVFAQYSEVFWANRKAREAFGSLPARPADDTRNARCIEIARRLVSEGKVFQPRLKDEPLAVHLVRHDQKGRLPGQWHKAWRFKKAMREGLLRLRAEEEGAI